MKRLTYALAVVVFLLLSCGDTHTSSKTSSLTFEEFKAKLRQLAGSGPREMVTCESCKGTGKAMGFVSKEITCERCKGVGHLTDVCLRCRGVGSCHQGEMAQDVVYSSVSYVAVLASLGRNPATTVRAQENGLEGVVRVEVRARSRRRLSVRPARVQENGPSRVISARVLARPQEQAENLPYAIGVKAKANTSSSTIQR